MGRTLKPRKPYDYDNLIHGSDEFADVPEGGEAVLDALAVAPPAAQAYLLRRLRSTFSRPQPTPPAPAPVDNGPGPRMTFAWGGKVASFGRAGKRYRLLCALWDVSKGEPHPQRIVQEVMDEVYEDRGDKIEYGEYDDSMRDLCLRVRQQLAAAEIPLTVTVRAGTIWLGPI